MTTKGVDQTYRRTFELPPSDEDEAGDGTSARSGSLTGDAAKDKLLRNRQALRAVRDDAGGAAQQRRVGVVVGGADVKAPLRARDYQVDLESQVGKTKVVAAGLGIGAPKAGGYYCQVCDSTLRDSSSYLDHINGRRHQGNLGMSMNVRKASVADVRATFAKAKAKKSEHDWAERLSKLNAADEKKQRKRRSKSGDDDIDDGWAVDADVTDAPPAKKARAEAGAAGTEAEAGAVGAEAEADEDEEARIARLMGFSGFGSSKK